MKKYLGLVLLLITACKTPNTDNSLKNAELKTSPEFVAPEPKCALDQKTWAGRMGIRLKDGSGAAEIECVVVGEGLHHIGLKVGDKIKALNGGEKVASVTGFETAASKVAGAVTKRWRAFQFQVDRGGAEQTVKASDEYPGCSLFSYDDCGPLAQ